MIPRRGVHLELDPVSARIFASGVVSVHGGEVEVYVYEDVTEEIEDVLKERDRLLARGGGYAGGAS